MCQPIVTMSTTKTVCVSKSFSFVFPVNLAFLILGNKIQKNSNKRSTNVTNKYLPNICKCKILH